MFKKAVKGIQAYRLWSRAYDLVTKWSSNMGTETVSGVPVKSAFLSKINWTNAVQLLVGVSAFLGYKISETDQATVLGAIMGVGAAVTIVLRTFWNRSVTPE
jgi:hypothetical protein